MRVFSSLLLVLSFLVVSCEKDKELLGTDWEEGVVTFSGQVAADGCGWLIISEGVSYSAVSLPEEFLKEGLDIWYKAKVLREYLNCGLVGGQLKILEINDVIKKPWHVRYLSDYKDRTTSVDGFSIDTVYVDGDSLRLHVGYSGGCAIHQFNLWAMDKGGDEDLHLMLEHIGNGDMCEAYLHEWLAFSLIPVRETDKNEVKFWLRGSPVMSMLFGEFIYKY
ncbi:MAG: hypothetical protein KAH17_06395 [Bacteroidales bacterium]|nr:hypothetical protein [Bacteroidales bacterium]